MNLKDTLTARDYPPGIKHFFHVWCHGISSSFDGCDPRIWHREELFFPVWCILSIH